MEVAGKCFRARGKSSWRGLSFRADLGLRLPLKWSYFRHLWGRQDAECGVVRMTHQWEETGKLSLLSLPRATLSIGGIAGTILLARARSKGAHFPQHNGLHLTQPRAQLSVSEQTHRCVQLLYWLGRPDGRYPVTACSPLGFGCHLYQAHPGLSQVTT